MRMIIFCNQNLLKLVVSSLKLYKAKLIFGIMKNKTQCQTILKISKPITVIYSSLGKYTIHLQGHKERITSIKTLPGNKMITASSDFNLWDMQKNQNIKALLPPKDYLGKILTLPEGLIVAGSKIGSLTFWDINKDYEEKSISFPKHYADFAKSYCFQMVILLVPLTI
jgi:WD40 repeat protein